MGGHLREPLRELVECSLPAALEAMGERWSFMILRAAFNGLHHFEEFQSELGIARNILANRLARLVEHEILTREALPEDRRKIQYRLTDKGMALLPTMVALRQWGERWETGVPAFPILVDRLREKLGSERAEERVRRMTTRFEKVYKPRRKRSSPG